MNNNILFDAISGVIYFGIVYTLIKLVQPHGPFAVIGVLYACTFLLYWFVYKIRSIKHYFISAAMLGGILGAFYWAGKQGMVAALGVYLLVLAWALYARRNKIKQAYKIFAEEADKALDNIALVNYQEEVKKEETDKIFKMPKDLGKMYPSLSEEMTKEEKPKTVKAKKPSRTSNKDKTKHKHKQKARKKDSHKASKSSTVKKNSKKRAKKATTN